jgi:hypothetical protein
VRFAALPLHVPTLAVCSAESGPCAVLPDILVGLDHSLVPSSVWLVRSVEPEQLYEFVPVQVCINSSCILSCCSSRLKHQPRCCLYLAP